MYQVLIETATIDETPPYISSGAQQLLGPGTQSHVYFTLYGAQAASEKVSVSGSDARVTYGSQGVIGLAQPEGRRSRALLARGPFTAGQRTIICLEHLAHPLDLGEIDRVVIGHTAENPGPAWYLKRVVVSDSSGQPTVFEVNRWLIAPDDEITLAREGAAETPGDQGTPVPPAPTPVPVEPLPDTGEIYQIDILSHSAARFVFNHSVNLTTFVGPGSGTDRARSLSIRYMDDMRGSNLTPEARATFSVENWVENPAKLIAHYGEYTWKDDRTLIVGPPEYGWPEQKYVRFEINQSLRDMNNQYLDRVYVLVAHVVGEAHDTTLLKVVDAGSEAITIRPTIYTAERRRTTSELF